MKNQIYNYDPNKTDDEYLPQIIIPNPDHNFRDYLFGTLLKNTDWGDLYDNLGICARYQGKNSRAKRYHEQALDWRGQHADPSCTCNALSRYYVGAVHFSENDMEAATQDFEKALNTLREILGNTTLATANMNANLAYIHHCFTKH